MVRLEHDAQAGLRPDLRHRHGRRSGWLRHGAARLLQGLGALRHLEAVDWRRVGRLVFVCRGNLCRSPYAEARARASGLAAASFGLEAGGGQVDRVARAAARRRGLELAGHRPMAAPSFRPDGGDLLLGMELWQARRLAELAAGAGAQVSLLGLWAEPSCPHLEDPYGLCDEYFDTCFSIIDRAVAALAGRLEVGHAR